jgi:hypothetical protein
VGGQWTLSDEVVLEFGGRAQAEGMLKHVFVDGSICTPEELLAMLKRPANVPIFIFAGRLAVGVAWLNGFSDRRTFGHFLFVKAGWGEFARRAGRLVLQYWRAFRVGDDPLFDVILGLVPSRNTLAIRFVQDIGLVRLGEIPKMLAGQTATLLYFVEQ